MSCFTLYYRQVEKAQSMCDITTLWARSSSSFDFTQITFLFVSTVVQKRSYYWKPVSSKSEIRELQRLIQIYDMRHFLQHVLLCTSTVHDQSGDICIQGYLKILWIRNIKSSKIDWIHKCNVSCFKLEYFCKGCTT